MIIRKIDDKNILISLSLSDMTKLSISEDNMTLKNEAFKDTLKAILTAAALETGVKCDGKRTKIEIYTHNSGCFLMVSFLNVNRSKKLRIRKKKNKLFIFKDFEDIIALSAKLNAMKINIQSDCVFECFGNYYLFLEDCSLQCEDIIEHYGKRIDFSTLIYARFKEYGNIIAKNNALSKIADAFI